MVSHGEPTTVAAAHGATGHGNPLVENILNRAMTWLGSMYLWGGNGANGGVDCSGLIYDAFNKGGYGIARYRAIDYGTKVGHTVPANGARPGDIVYFDNPGTSTDHVGIYLGSGMMIEAPTQGKPVRISQVRGGAVYRRVLPDSAWSGMTKSNGNFVYGFDGKTYTSSADNYVYNGPTPGAAGAFMTSNSSEWRAIAKTVPEVAKILAQGNMSTEQFEAAIRNTTWWKTHSDTYRQRVLQQVSDPATYKQEYAQAEAQFRAIYSKIGVQVPGSYQRALVAKIMNEKWGEDEIRAWIGQHGVLDPNAKYSGEAAGIVSKIGQMATAWGSPATTEGLNHAVRNVLTGKRDLTAYEAWFKSIAKSMFPAYAKQIDGGTTVQELAQPFIGAMGQILELNTNGIKTDDPLLRKGLQYVDPGGQPAARPLWDFEHMLRQDPRWDKTKNATNSAYGAINRIAEDFGLLAWGG